MIMANTSQQSWLAIGGILYLFFMGLAGCSHLPSADSYRARIDRALGIDTSQAIIADEKWFAMYREGRKTGWHRLSNGFIEHSGQRFQLHLQTTYERCFRNGHPVENKQVVKTIHNMENQFVASAAVTYGGNQTPTFLIATNEGENLKINLWRGKTEDSKTINRGINSMFPLIKQILMLRPKVGSRKIIQLFDPQDLRVYDYTIKVISRVEFDLKTGSEPAWYVQIEHGHRLIQDIFISTDGQCRILKIICHDEPVIYLPETAHKTKLDPYDFNEIHDIKLATTISSSWSVQTVTMDISNEALNSVLIEDPWQVRLNDTSANGTRWIFRAHQVEDTKSQNLPLTIEGAHNYLSATFYIQSDHPKIRQTAAMIKGHEVNALRLFRKIAMWVFNTIEDKDFSTSLASALETLDRKQGDCTEHAVLTAALARAAGIPTRIAAGLYYAEERFSYHMWVEALVAEKLWVAVDPAMGQIEPDALHLKLFHGDLDYNTHTNMTWALIQSLKSGDLKIVEFNKTF
jgi:hypothetical protein